MTSTDPTFFLASTESYAFRGPFKCWVEAEVKGEMRSDYLLVRIEPPAVDPNTKESMERIIVAGRYRPTNLEELPATVYIAKITDPSVISRSYCKDTSIKVVTSGDIFPTFEAAKRLADDQ